MNKICSAARASWTTAIQSLRAAANSMMASAALAPDRDSLAVGSLVASQLQVQRLAAHRGHQVLCGREFLTGQGSAQASCEQRERSVDRQPGQIMRTAPTNRDPAGGADHQGASGKDIEQIASLRRIGGGVVDSDDEARLAQQLRALTGSELDRLVRAVQIGHQLL